MPLRTLRQAQYDTSVTGNDLVTREGVQWHPFAVAFENLLFLAE